MFKNHQIGGVVWLYGMSGAGKTTLSLLLKSKLDQAGHLNLILDGDELRSGINKDLSFSMPDRLENIRRVAEIAKVVSANQILVICALITPLKEHRALAKSIIGENFLEVFIDCPISICKQRDVKGLYKLSDEKKITNFTGISSAFEPSDDSDLVLETAIASPQQCALQLYNFIQEKLNAAPVGRLCLANETAVEQ